MDSAEITLATSTDFDAIVLDSIPVNDGIWALAGFDDDRSVFAWSPGHARRCIEQLAIARNRVAVAEWALADVQKRGLAAAVAKAGAHVARARAELAEWETKTHQQEAFRKATAGASPVSLLD